MYRCALNLHITFALPIESIKHLIHMYAPKCIDVCNISCTRKNNYATTYSASQLCGLIKGDITLVINESLHNWNFSYSTPLYTTIAVSYVRK